MKKKTYLLGLLFLFFVNLNAQTPYFYYYNGEKNYLELDTKHVFVSVADENTAKTFASLNVIFQSLRIDIPGGIRSETICKRFWTVFSFEDSLSEEAYLTKLTEIKNAEKDIVVAPYFKNQFQDQIGLSNFFIVRLKSLNDTILLKQEVEKEHAIIVYQDELMPLWFVASVTEHSRFNAMEMANRFHESGLFLHAVPDLMEDVKMNCANDQHFGQQWGLRNTVQNGIDINICAAWQISTGSNVTVAVLDQGIDLTHPDLATNIHPLSFDSESLTVPQVIHGDHGTACAGIIGALRNNVVGGTTLGIAGVAPNCSIMSVSNSLAGTPLSRLRRANGINWAWRNGADIISNSWSSTVQYPEIDEAIDSAVIRGRGGRGCVVVFSSGNDYASSVSYPASLPDVIAVGAINRNGNRADFSNYGIALDVVAPGVDIYTTDRQGNAGYNTSSGAAGNYYANFGGTSAAAPHVAGVAALILSVRPDLTALQVRNAIETTCRRLSAHPATGTGQNGQPRDNQTGCGLVNAYAAVNSVVPTISGPKDLCVGFPSKTFTVTNAPAGAAWGKSSNLLLSDLGTSALVSAIGSGSGWVSITFDSIELVRYNVSVCSSAPVFDFIEGPDEVTPGAGTHYYQAHFNNATPTDYEWWVYGAPSSWYIISINGYVTTNICFIGEATYAVYVHGSNACGGSGGQILVAAYSRGGQAYTVYPNPVNDILTISAAQQAGSGAKTAQLLDIRLYDLQGNLALRKTANNSADIQLDVSGLRDGNYFLHIYEGLNATPYMKQIVVRH